MTRRILHPSDFSRASGAAFKKAVEMAKAAHAELMTSSTVTTRPPFSLTIAPFRVRQLARFLKAPRPGAARRD